MKYPFYYGNGTKGKETVVLPSTIRRSQLQRPDKYLADPGLVDACNVALLLGQPLLLTGEPGTGKTQFAFSLAWELGLNEPLKFETKSTSNSKELFYTYDALRRFHDIQNEIRLNSALPYITFHALGTAILRTCTKQEIAPYISEAFQHEEPSRSIVLIDEIDKAPRDFSNDILNELEQMYFRIPELNNVKIEANLKLQPIVICTSNSEKDLPDAFLRRCVYYHIPFPTQERLREIILSRIEAYSTHSHSFIDDALELFYLLRAPTSGLRKKPATSELLGWLITLNQLAASQTLSFAQSPDLILRSLSNLIKTAEDQWRATEIVKLWISKQNN